MTKEEKIQEAYGTYWEDVKQYVDKDGYTPGRRWFVRNLEKLAELNAICRELDKTIEIERNREHSWRPKTLTGIENNNNWIKPEELPISYLDRLFWIITKDEDRPLMATLRGVFFHADNGLAYSIEEISHYQVIKLIEKPLY